MSWIYEKTIKNKKFWKKRKSYVTIFTISLIIIIGSVVLFIFFINKRNYNLNHQINFYDLGLVDKRTGANIYMDLYEKPILVDNYSNKNNDLFYVEKNNMFYFIESDQELIDAYLMLINFNYYDKFIKTTIVSDNQKNRIEKYIKEKN